MMKEDFPCVSSSKYWDREQEDVLGNGSVVRGIKMELSSGYTVCRWLLYEWLEKNVGQEGDETQSKNCPTHLLITN